MLLGFQNPIDIHSSITKAPFGKDSSGETIDLFTLQNASGGVVQITNFGATLISAKMPDCNGNLSEITLGFDHFDEYLENEPYFGSIVGRYANRIANGEFSIDGEKHILAKNMGKHHLHGGLKGFDKQIWEANIIEKEGNERLQLTYLSPDGEEGYPGNLRCTVTYGFFQNNELTIDYQAISDRKTVINLTSHVYFNLKNGGKTDVHSHELKINANHITSIDSTGITTGKLLLVEQTPFDFINFKPIGKDIANKHPQLEFGNGYDHNFVLNISKSPLCVAAEVIEPDSGRTLTVLTTEPGIQLYTGNWLDNKGKEGIHYQNRSAFCLETQHFPDSPNQPHFPSTILEAGDVYESKTIYRFGILK